MTPNGWLQIAVFFVLVLLAAKPMGLYMARVYERKKTWLDPVLVPVERLLYADRRGRRSGDALDRVRRGDAGVQPGDAAADLWGGAAAAAIPLWNPQHLAAVEPYLAWNTAARLPPTPTGRRTCPRRR